MKRYLIFFLILFSVVGCDQATKSIARKTLAPFVQSSYLGDTVRVQLMENPGAFLSLGAGMDSTARFSVLVIGTFIFLFGLTLFLILKKNLSLWTMTALTLILAGGIGNLIDRVIRGTVTDFLNLGIGSIRTGIFNIADVAITAGVVMIFFSNSVESKPDQESS